MQPTSLFIALLASTNLVLATISFLNTTSTSTSTTLISTTPTTFTAIAITQAPLQNRGAAEAENNKNDDGNCLSTSYSKYKDTFVTITTPYEKNCKHAPVGVGAVQNVGFHG